MKCLICGNELNKDKNTYCQTCGTLKSLSQYTSIFSWSVEDYGYMGTLTQASKQKINTDEQKRIKEENRRLEKQRIEDQHRLEKQIEAARIAEQKRIIEQNRRIEEQRIADIKNAEKSKISKKNANQNQNLDTSNKEIAVHKQSLFEKFFSCIGFVLGMIAGVFECLFDSFKRSK